MNLSKAPKISKLAESWDFIFGIDLKTLPEAS